MKYWVIVGEGGGYEEVKSVKATENRKEEVAKNPKALDRRVIRQDDITFTIERDGKRKLYVNGFPEEAPDLFLLWGHYNEQQEGINDCLLSLGAKSVNPIEGKRIVCSKLKTADVLGRAGIPQPKTLLLDHGTDADMIEKELGIPVVVKPSDGAQGEGVKLLKTREELDAYIQALPERLNGVILAQEFIASSKGRDVRVYIIDHKYMASGMRIAGNADEFRSNLHQGGRVELYPIDEAAQKMCEKVSEICGLRICGVDLLITGDGYVVGEVNCTPGMTVLDMGSEQFRKTMQGVVLNTLNQ
ncbi:MAG: RimK family alpha-L-glutamate ligase [Eubacterium sp.]|nr:RimK family alpha-L-glutamate ligase [Eubacterium sp.]